MLCRRCCRTEHEHNPLHHIEFWTGLHFRKADLWEVGTFLRIPHRNYECDIYAKHIDIVSFVASAGDATSKSGQTSDDSNPASPMDVDPPISLKEEQSKDAEILRRMEALYQDRDLEEGTEETLDEDDPDLMQCDELRRALDDVDEDMVQDTKSVHPVYPPGPSSSPNRRP